MTDFAHANVTVVQHPVIQERLTMLRDRRTEVEEFRRLMSQIARLMTFEITRDYASKPVSVETPLRPFTGSALAARITLVPILRAGLGMVDGVLQLFPDALLGHIGIHREEKSLEPVVYYRKLPPGISRTEVILLDPMFATGASLGAAIKILREAGASRIKALCLVASPQGAQRLMREHADVHLYVAAIDRGLDSNGFVVPGVGDAGDRLLGTA